MRPLLHRLVNKIAIVSGYSDLLLRTELTEEQRDMVDEIKKAAEEAHGSHALLELELDLK